MRARKTRVTTDSLDKKLQKAHKKDAIDGYYGCTKVHQWCSADRTGFRAGKYKDWLFKRHKLFS